MKTRPSLRTVPREKGTLRKAQDALESWHKHYSVMLPQVPFGPALAGLGGAALADAVVWHRINSKLERPDSKSAKTRKADTMTRTLAYDLEAAPVDFNWRTSLWPSSRKHWINAQAWLRDTFRGFKPSYRFVPPSGESSTPSYGHNDVMQKLSDISFWEVSPSALPYATAIIYNNLHLKAVVRKHFKAHAPSIYGVDGEAMKLRWSILWSSKTGVSLGYYVFTKMVRSLMTLTDVSRMSTVSKNNRTDRPIDMVPFWNMVAQLSCMSDMRRQVYKTRGIDLSNLADLHKTLIRHDHLATIDLKNASNSFWCSVIEQLWPKSMTRHLFNLRNAYTEADGVYHQYEMFGPMGCGLTFDVMTFTLHSLVQNFGFASVFGDDVICPVNSVGDVLHLIKQLGMQVNVDKTFASGNFRESCGGYHDLSCNTDIVSYDIEFPLNLFEVTVIANKVKRIADAGQCSLPTRVALRELFDVLAAHIDSDFSVESGDVDCGAILRPQSTVRLCGPVTIAWQRAVPYARVLTLETTSVKPEYVAAEACFMFARRSYSPKVRKVRENKQTVCYSTRTRLTRELVDACELGELAF